jgi:hypothetical protein
LQNRHLHRFFGNEYQFMGENKSSNAATKYLIANLRSNQIEGGSKASGYPTNITISRASCPNETPRGREMNS